MSDNELYALFWKLVAALLLTLMIFCSLTTVIKTNKTNDIVSRMVTEGVNPKKAGCAVAIANNSTTEGIRLYCAIPE